MVTNLRIVVLMALGLMLSAAIPVSAADKNHEGKVVSVTAGSGTTDGKLVMTDNDGKEHSHAILDACKITLNDKPAKLTDLKAGDSIKIHEEKDGKVKKVVATRKT